MLRVGTNGYEGLGRRINLDWGTLKKPAREHGAAHGYILDVVLDHEELTWIELCRIGEFIDRKPRDGASD